MLLVEGDKRMYANLNNRVSEIKGIYLIINTENGAVVGVDKKGFQEYQQLISSTEYRCEDVDLYNFLLDNEFISKQPFKKHKQQINAAYVHVTNKCNLHCLGCYSDNNARNLEKDISTEEMEHVLQELGGVGVENLVISGGEPLLRGDIVQLVRYAKEYCKINTITLITNGTIDKQEVFEGMSPYLDTIAVSLDTYSMECPSYLRDEGIFNKILIAIGHMQKAGLQVSILPTVHHKNVAKMKEYIDLSKRLHTQISFSIFTTCKDKAFEGYALNTEDLNEIAEHFITYGISADDVPINNTLEGKRNCGTGCSMLSIGADASVYPCHMLMEEQFKMGNLIGKTIREVLGMHQDRLWEVPVEEISGCKECDYKYLCGGGCRARAYMINRDIQSPDPFCDMYRGFYASMLKNIKDHSVG